MKMHKIILAGNPNVGKSTVFNALTGMKQHTGNWSGKTVDLAYGSFVENDIRFEILDLPGTYSVISNSPEEEIAKDYICFSDNDLTVIVADATCLERNLNLTLQICEMCNKVLLCVNLLDEADTHGIVVDIGLLEKTLGIPVIGICAKNNRDIKRLKKTISKYAVEYHHLNIITVEYSTEIENEICEISNKITCDMSDKIKRLIALKLLDNKELGLLLAKKYIKDINILNNVIESAHISTERLNRKNIPPIAVRDIIVESIINTAIETADKCRKKSTEIKSRKTELIDKIVTSKKLGIPVMICFFALLLWITVSLANYPSRLLSVLFSGIKIYLDEFLLMLNVPAFFRGLISDGVYGTAAWVTSVMLPPMAIFFPLFTLLEDFGFLPRIAFNLDRCFCHVNSSGKQALTMCMGIGCNAVGVTGCRIISSKKERLAAIITNTFMPCNGRFGMLISLSAIFIGGAVFSASSSFVSAMFVLFLIIIGAIATLGITKILTKIFSDGNDTDFSLELPPYRKPQLIKILARSLLDRTLIILGRALSISAPAGAIIWILANVSIGDVSILEHISNILNPVAGLMGFDGVILLAFVLALPANEIVLPIILMCYLSTTQMVDVSDLSHLAHVLKENGWTMLTAINVMLFSVMHFPCATTLKTIKKETGSTKLTLIAFILPTLVGAAVCMFTNLLWTIFL